MPYAVTTLVRWPLTPLLDAAGGGSFSRLALLVGVSPRAVAKWAQVGLTDRAADRAAIKLDMHPALIWPGWDDPDMQLAKQPHVFHGGRPQ
jgi:hypothetical protein